VAVDAERFRMRTTLNAYYTHPAISEIEGLIIIVSFTYYPFYNARWRGGGGNVVNMTLSYSR